LSSITWAEDGFPIFGERGHVALEQETSLELEPHSAPPARDDFDEPELSLSWNHLRNPDPKLYSLRERPGYLRLHGSADGLDDVAATAWLGRRQCHFSVRVAARLEFRPTSEREEAGLVVRMNEQHHYEIFVTRRAGVPSVILRRRIGSLRAEVAVRPWSASDDGVVLAIDADREQYSFFFGAAESDLERLGAGETRYLSTEVAGGFTGVYFAMYASGNGAACVHPADFAWFDYREREDGT
jgi:alpha-N-arabinofuranosidase